MTFLAWAMLNRIMLDTMQEKDFGLADYFGLCCYWEDRARKGFFLMQLGT